MTATPAPPSPSPAPSSRFGALLKHYRRTAGLTQEALAARAGVSVRGIQNLERGVNWAPRSDTIALLAEALGLSPEEHAALADAARRPVRALTGPAVLPGAARGGAPSAGLTPLIGRQRELALLDQCLTSDGPMLLLAGEPGMGKTRLLQAVAQRAIAQGWSVLSGGCQRRGGQEPYAPLLDALARHVQALPPERQRRALAGCAWLVRLLPELADVLEPLPAWSVPPEQERRLLFAAVTRLLANVAGLAGALLILDDLQWAGGDALDLLAALLRRPPTTPPLRVVGAYRDTEVRPADPVGLRLADLAQAGLVRRHALDPLTPDEARVLLADLLATGTGGEGTDGMRGDSVAGTGVLERAGGVPFFLVSYAQALQQGRTEGAETAARTQAAPWNVTQGVGQRVALLPETAQVVLGAAAIVGRRVPWALLVAVTGLPDDAVAAGLEAVCQARLLLEDGDDGYTFAHDVIREVVEADLGAARRTLLHRRVATVLEGNPAGASAELLAYHFIRGGRADKAASYLEQAGDQAWAQRAHDAVERHYRETIDGLDRLGRAREAARVREKLGEALFQTGRYAAAITVLEPAGETLRITGDVEGLRRVMARIGWSYARRSRPREGLALLQPLLDGLDQRAASPALAALYAALAQLCFAVGQYDEALSACDRAAAVVSGGDERTRMLAMGLRMTTLQHLGRLGEALRASSEALPLAEVVGDLDGLLRAHRDLAHIYELHGELTASQQHLERALTVAARLDDAGQRALTLAFHGWVACVSGDKARARDTLDEAVALSRQGDRSWYSAYPLILRARLALVEGAWDDARALVRDALAQTDDRENRRAVRWAAGVLAELDILEGRPEVAAARLAPLVERTRLRESDVTALLPAVAWAQVEQGRLDAAAATVEQALTQARQGEMRLVLVEALRVQALIAVRHGQGDAATRSLEEGVALARDMPYPYAEARLLFIDGLLHVQAGRPKSACERFAAALVIFQQLGARKDIERTAHALIAAESKLALIQIH